MITFPVLLLLGLIAVLAAIAGYTEDLESVIGSQSNPNSQVQLAPQVMRPHRYFNKAISGEPISNALTATIGASVAYLFTYISFPFLVSLVLGSIVASLFHAYLAFVSHTGRIASQGRFKQPLYKDVIRSHIFPIAAYAFLTVFCILSISYILKYALEHPFPFPLISLILGISVGSIGSSIGDVYYGAESLYQNYPFGAGINAAHSGDIVRKGASGILTNHDHTYFCSMFGAPATGLAFSATVFLTTWITSVFNPKDGTIYGVLAIILGILFIICLFVLNRILEIYAHHRFGPYRETEKGDAVDI